MVPTEPLPNDLCECGHTREEHGHSWHVPKGCPCREFVQAYWTQEEVDEVKRKAKKYAEILGWGKR